MHLLFSQGAPRFASSTSEQIVSDIKTKQVCEFQLFLFILNLIE